MGSCIGSPGFGLIHPTTISAAVLQDAGLFEEDDNPENPMRFNAISLAPNFDIPIGRYRVNDIVNLITKWILCDPEEEEALVSIPPDDLSFDDFVNLRHVPLILRESWDREVYRTVFETTTKHTEDQLLSKEEGEREPAISPPPPTEPELDDPIVFDPMVTGIWDHLLALMTDEQKTQLKEQANNETASPSYRHVSTTGREGSPQSVQSRGPSRSHPVYLGVVAMAANRTNAFENFRAVMNVVLPCTQREAVAMFTRPPWVHRVQHCTTPEDVMEAFRLYHSTEDKTSTDPVLKTKRGAERY